MFFYIKHAGAAENFQALAPRIIHQEQCDAIVRGQISGGEQLPVAAEIRERERLRIEHAEKSARAAAMLDIGPPGFGNGREIERITFGDEGALIVGEQIPLGRKTDGGGATVVMFLRGQHGGREDGLFETIRHGRSFVSFGGFIKFAAVNLTSFRSRLLVINPEFHRGQYYENR